MDNKRLLPKRRPRVNNARFKAAGKWAIAMALPPIGAQNRFALAMDDSYRKFMEKRTHG